MTKSHEHEALAEQIAAERWPDDIVRRYAFVAMIRQESGDFDLDVIEGRRLSSEGAKGIAQLMPMWWDRADPLDPPAALRFAAWLLDDETSRIGDLHGGVAAYNAGSPRVLEARRQGGSEWVRFLPAQTRDYLRIVLTEVDRRLGEDDRAVETPLHYLPDRAWWVPVVGYITDDYGATRPPPLDYHRGVDIGCPMGAEVMARTAGVVRSYALTGGYGNLLTIDCADGSSHLYAHLSALVTAVGARVAEGDVVALAGSTGNSTGPHLHYEVRQGGMNRDPAPWLAARPAGAKPGPEPEPEPNEPRIVVRVTAPDGLNLRAGPGTEHAVIAAYPAGVEGVLQTEEWLPVVMADGQRGWMHGAYNELVVDAPAPVADPRYATLRGEVLQWLEHDRLDATASETMRRQRMDVIDAGGTA